MTQTPGSSSTSDDSYQSEYKRVTEPAQAAALLRRLAQGRDLLAVTIAGVPGEVFTSALLDVAPDHDSLILDELREPGHTLLSEARRCRISGHVDGVEITFTAALLDEQPGNGYRIGFPQVVNYLQRRQSYRVQLGVLADAPVVLDLADAAPLEGELYDISSGGTCILALAETVNHLQAGQEIPRCTITLPNSETITAALEIRHLRPTSGGRFLIGGRFVVEDPREQKRIERVVAMLERDSRKRRSKAV